MCRECHVRSFALILPALARVERSAPRPTHRSAIRRPCRHPARQADPAQRQRGAGRASDASAFAGEPQAVADATRGRWQATFPARMPLAARSRSRSAAPTAPRELDDVMVGDVWLCSGQSNMEYPLRRALNGDGEVQAAGRPDLRLMKVPQQLADDAAGGLRQGAVVAARRRPIRCKDFSAACYFHGARAAQDRRRCRSARSTTPGAGRRSARG